MNNFKSLLGKIGAKFKGAGTGGPPISGAPLFGLVFLLGGGYAAANSLVTIEPGHLGLVYNRIGGDETTHVPF